MKLTTSRTGLHKVRVGDRVVVLGTYGAHDVVTRVGRTHVHCGRDAYSIATGERRANRYGFGIQAWEPAAHEASKRMEAKADLLMKRTNAWYEVAKLTESQLDRILAILEEVQT